MTIKEKILSASLNLFNTDGVEKVTTRHIAKYISISQGNLHYHYPNKDQLILAIFDSFTAEIKRFEKYVPNTNFLKEDVLLSLQTNFEVMNKYRFLFIDNEVVWRRLPVVKQKTIDLFDLKKKEIKAVIDHYKIQNIFRSDISNEQINYLAEQFIFSVVSWLGAANYLKIDENHVNHFAKFTFRLWLPYITAEKMCEWEAIL